MAYTILVAQGMKGVQFEHRHLWKLRERTAPSAPKSEREIKLYIFWNGDTPSLSTKKDPLLWSIWLMKSGWSYVIEERSEAGFRTATFPMTEKEALAEYRKLVKAFPRSKEIDYGLPLVADEPGA